MKETLCYIIVVKGEIVMLDRYDAALIYNSALTEASYCSMDKGGSLLLQYTAWCELKGIPDDDFNQMRSAF